MRSLIIVSSSLTVAATAGRAQEQYLRHRSIIRHVSATAGATSRQRHPRDRRFTQYRHIVANAKSSCRTSRATSSHARRRNHRVDQVVKTAHGASARGEAWLHWCGLDHRPWDRAEVRTRYPDSNQAANNPEHQVWCNYSVCRAGRHESSQVISATSARRHQGA